MVIFCISLLRRGMNELGRVIMDAVAETLDIPQDVLTNSFKEPFTLLRLLCYPPMPESGMEIRMLRCPDMQIIVSVFEYFSIHVSLLLQRRSLMGKILESARASIETMVASPFCGRIVLADYRYLSSNIFTSLTYLLTLYYLLTRLCRATCRDDNSNVRSKLQCQHRSPYIGSKFQE